MIGRALTPNEAAALLEPVLHRHHLGVMRGAMLPGHLTERAGEPAMERMRAEEFRALANDPLVLSGS